METTYFAQVYNTKVNNVICASQEFVDNYDDGLPGVWLLTDYYTHGNIHYGPDGQPDGKPPFRGNYAGIGYTYDDVNDVFYAPKPYKNAVLSQTSWTWVQPVPELPTITNVIPITNGAAIFYLSPTTPPASGIVAWRYLVETNSGVSFGDLPMNQNPFYITGIDGGVPCTINIGCTDAEGNTYWTINPELLIPSVAQPPSITSAIPQNNGAIINWATSEGQDIYQQPVGSVYWQIGYKPESSSGDYTWVDSDSPAETYTLTGLTNGTKYAVVVVDIVNGLDSDPSQPFYVTPAA